MRIMPIRSELKNHYLYLMLCKTLPSTHNIYILSSENHCEITTASISHLCPLLSSIIVPKYIVLRPARSPGGGDTSNR